MVKEIELQGRTIKLDDIALIKKLLDDNPYWHRTRLSRELCISWNWRNPAGQMKDMACRTLLLKLEQKGLINLPPRQRPANINAHRNRDIPHVPHATDPIDCLLSQLTPLKISRVISPADKAFFAV